MIKVRLSAKVRSNPNVLGGFNFRHGTCVGASSPKVFYKSSMNVINHAMDEWILANG
jgi:hypothetical protein